MHGSDQRARTSTRVRAIGVFVLRGSDWLVVNNGVTEGAQSYSTGENALKFDLSGVERRSKHDIFKSQCQLGKFHDLCNELRKYLTKFSEYCIMLPSAFDCTVQVLR